MCAKKKKQQGKRIIIQPPKPPQIFGGKGTGFSGVENPLFTNDNTVMIYGDAKATVSALVSEFNDQ